jgi:hypothetical protein
VQVATVTPGVTASTGKQLNTVATITLNGFGFDPTPVNNSVVFNRGAAGTVTSASATQLTVTFTTPPAEGSLTAVVTSNGVSSGTAVQVATVVPVVNVLAAPPVPPLTPATSQSQWVAQVYQDVFGMMVSPAALGQALQQLQSHSEFEVVLKLLGQRGLKQSYQLLVIEALYQDLLQRPATAAELKAALAYLNKPGHSFAGFEERFLGVPKELDGQALLWVLVRLYLDPNVSGQRAAARRPVGCRAGRGAGLLPGLLRPYPGLIPA